MNKKHYAIEVVWSDGKKEVYRVAAGSIMEASAKAASFLKAKPYREFSVTAARRAKTPP